MYWNSLCNAPIFAYHTIHVVIWKVFSTQHRLTLGGIIEIYVLWIEFHLVSEYFLLYLHPNYNFYNILDGMDLQEVNIFCFSFGDAEKLI